MSNGVVAKNLLFRLEISSILPFYYYFVRFGKSDLYEKILFCREIPWNMTFIRFRISDSFEQSWESRQIESSCTKRAILTKSRAQFPSALWRPKVRSFVFLVAAFAPSNVSLSLFL
jgi:hypothetical protein